MIHPSRPSYNARTAILLASTMLFLAQNAETSPAQHALPVPHQRSHQLTKHISYYGATGVGTAVGIDLDCAAVSGRSIDQFKNPIGGEIFDSGLGYPRSCTGDTITIPKSLRGNVQQLGVALDFNGFGFALLGDPDFLYQGTIPSGAAFEVTTFGGGFLLAKLFPPDRTLAVDFGSSVAFTGGGLLVGDPLYKSVNGTSAGAAFIYASFTLATTSLIPSDLATGDAFGFSVAGDATFAIISSPNKSLSSSPGGEGAVYVFDALTGAELRRLSPTDLAPQDHFGQSVAIEGGVVVVGSRSAPLGAAYVFDARTGAQILKLVPQTACSGGDFGASVSINAIAVLVGNPVEDAGARESGAAYLFDISTGRQRARYIPHDPTALKHFGASVALGRSGAAAVGAPGDEEGGPGSGAAYTFDATMGHPHATAIPRNGTGLNPQVFSSGLPYLGETWRASVDATGHQWVATMALYEKPSSGILVGAGELLVDVTSTRFMQRTGMSRFNSTVPFGPFNIPYDFSLLGMHLFGQAAILDGPQAILTNAIDLVLGF